MTESTITSAAEETIPKRKSAEVLTQFSNSQVQKSKHNIIKRAICMPGQKICVSNEYFEAGEGAYEFGDAIYSSVLGYLSTTEFPDQELTVISVQTRQKPFVSPHLMAIVTCTVVSRTRKFCRCLITHVGNVKLDEGIRGIIRREYITDTQKDLAEIETSFGVGDTVLARIVGIGGGDFIMSTAEDGLGVATGLSEAGYYMVPIGWTHMECPKTRIVYPRKVARILQPQNMIDLSKIRNAVGGNATSEKSIGHRSSNSGGDSE